jgi:hypothetical protein
MKQIENESWSLTTREENKEVSFLKERNSLDLKHINSLATGKKYMLTNFVIIELNSRSRFIFETQTVSQIVKMTSLLLNPKIHCCVHKNLWPVPVFNHKNSVPILPAYLIKIRFNIILPFSVILPSVIFLSECQPTFHARFYRPHACYMPSASHIRLYLIVWTS